MEQSHLYILFLQPGLINLNRPQYATTEAQNQMRCDTVTTPTETFLEACCFHVHERHRPEFFCYPAVGVFRLHSRPVVVQVFAPF